MKELLKEWKQYSEYHELFERHEYIECALGFEPILNESGGAYYTSDIKEQIIKEHLLFEGFFSQFNPIEAIKKYGKEVGELFSTLYSVIKNPKYIPDFVSAVINRILDDWKEKINSVVTWLEGKNMSTFAAGLKKIVSGINSIINMEVNWKKAVLITGVVVGIAYLFDKLKDVGLDILGGIGDIKDKALEAAENFITNEFPQIMAKLYGKAALAASSGFLGWVVAAVAVVKVVNLAKDALKPMFYKYKQLTDRRDNREKIAQDGRIRLENKLKD